MDPRVEDHLRKDQEKFIICGNHTKPPDKDTSQKIEKECKKRNFVVGQRIWLDHSQPCFLLKELHSCNSSSLIVNQLPCDEGDIESG